MSYRTILIERETHNKINLEHILINRIPLGLGITLLILLLQFSMPAPA